MLPGYTIVESPKSVILHTQLLNHLKGTKSFALKIQHFI